MAGDWVSPICTSNLSYVEQTIELGVEHSCLSQEALARLAKLVAAGRYVDSEGVLWRDVIQKIENCRSGGFWRGNGGEGWNAHLFDMGETVLRGPPPPAPLPEVERQSVETLLGLLIDKYSASEVSVLMDAALAARMP